MRDEKLEREYPEVRSNFTWMLMIRVFYLVGRYKVDIIFIN